MGKKTLPLKKNGGENALSLFFAKKILFYFFYKQKREVANFVLQFAKLLFCCFFFTFFFTFFILLFFLICFFSLILLKTLGFFIESFISKKV